MKITTKKLLSLLLVFTLLLGLAACKEEGKKTPDTTTTAPEALDTKPPVQTDQPPESTGPVVTDPVLTTPVPSEPEMTDPVPTTPVPTTPVPTTPPAAPLAITKHPGAASVTTANASMKFSVTVSGGTAPYQYKWYTEDKKQNATTVDKVFDTVSGADTATVTLQVTGNNQSGNIWCVVTDAAGKTVTSNKAQLKVNIPMTLTKHPTGESKTAGEWAHFTVKVSGGSGSYLYRWYTDISGKEVEILDSKYAVGARTAQLSLWTQRSDRTGSVWCVVEDASNGKKLTSEKAALTLVNPLYISWHPSDITVAEGGGATFLVEAAGGTAPYTYQWHCALGDEEVEVDSGTSLSFVDLPKELDGMKVWCVVTDAAGAEDVSAVATLTVKPAPTQPPATTPAPTDPPATTPAPETTPEPTPEA